MLVSTIDGAIARDAPLDVTDRIGIREYLGHHTVPLAVSGIAAVALRHCPPRTEVLTRQVTPRDAGTVAVDDTLDYPAIALKQSGSLAGIRG